MPNAISTYIAKRAAALVNPLTNDSIFLSADSSSFASFVEIPGDGASGLSLLDGLQIRVRASGKCHIVTSSTLIITLYYCTACRTSITPTTTGVATTGATITSGSMTAPYDSNWSLTAEFQWDVTSKIMNGLFYGITGPTPTVTGLTVTTQLTSNDWTTVGAGFVMGAHLGTGNAASTVQLSNFSLEVL